jgi:hypothetical protein
LGEIMDVKLYASARQLAAFAGLVPRPARVRQQCEEEGEAVEDWRAVRMGKQYSAWVYAP